MTAEPPMKKMKFGTQAVVANPTLMQDFEDALDYLEEDEQESAAQTDEEDKKEVALVVEPESSDCDNHD